MKIVQKKWMGNTGLEIIWNDELANHTSDHVMAFGNMYILNNPGFFETVNQMYLNDLRVKKEGHIIRQLFGNKTSYGETTSSFNFSKSELYNKIMTISTPSEN